MTLVTLAPYHIRSPFFWKTHATSTRTWALFEEALDAGWYVVTRWGAGDGWEISAQWPFEGIFFDEHLHIASLTETEVNVYHARSRIVRDAIADTLALDYWRRHNYRQFDWMTSINQFPTAWRGAPKTLFADRQMLERQHLLHAA